MVRALCTKGVSGPLTLDLGFQGEIVSNHLAERTFTGAAPEVVFVRCAYFMENWASALPTLKEDPPFFHSTISPASNAVPMVCIIAASQ